MTFTKREQKKLTAVFDKLRAELKAGLTPRGYNNDLGCGNCGDTGPFHGLLYRLEQEVGVRKECGCVPQKCRCYAHKQMDLARTPKSVL